jgi:hypothetical protein
MHLSSAPSIGFGEAIGVTTSGETTSSGAVSCATAMWQRLPQLDGMKSSVVIQLTTQDTGLV